MTHQTVEVVAKNRASLESLASRLGLGSPIKLYVSSKLWVATFLSEEASHRSEVEQRLTSIGY